MRGLALLQAPYPTVGDEFQAVAYTLEDALLLTLRAQLLLPPQLQLRFGIGAGRIEEFASGVHRQAPARGRGAESAALQDGSAWWAARAAINRAHDVQDSLQSVHSHVVHGACVRRIRVLLALPDLHQRHAEPARSFDSQAVGASSSHHSLAAAG